MTENSLGSTVSSDTVSQSRAGPAHVPHCPPSPCSTWTQQGAGVTWPVPPIMPSVMPTASGPAPYTSCLVMKRSYKMWDSSFRKKNQDVLDCSALGYLIPETSIWAGVLSLPVLWHLKGQSMAALWLCLLGAMAVLEVFNALHQLLLVYCSHLSILSNGWNADFV